MEAIIIQFETYKTLFINSIETNISPLYTINPITPSGKKGESLTSYLSRLANSHSVSVSNLIFYMIFQPHFKGKISKNPYRINSNINGYGKYTILTLEKLKELSNANITTKITLDKFKNFYSKTNLLRKHKSWCKACLNEMKNKIVYEKLIWSIAEYKICTSHQSFLIDICNKCEKKQIINPVDGKNGYCQHCNNWLGEEDRNDPPYFELVKEDERYYKSKQIEEMLDYYYDKHEPIKSDLASSFMKIEDISKKDMFRSELCKYLGIPQATFHFYCRGENKFTLERVLNISWNLKIGIVKLMNHQNIEYSFNKSKFIPGKRRYSNNTDKKSYEQYMMEIIKSKKYIPLNQLGENLDVAQKTLKSRFPNLIKEIDDYNKSVEKRFGKKLLDRNYENNYITIYNRLIEFIHSPELIAVNKIAHELNLSTIILKERFPKVFELIKLKNKLLIKNGKAIFHPNLDFSYIESFLKEILAIKKYITQRDISIYLNVSIDVLKRRYPDLIKRISNNNRIYRIENGKKLSEKGYKNNRTEIQNYLKGVLNSSKLIRISQITKDLGISIYLLNRWFPELIERITYKNSELMQSKGGNNVDIEITYPRTRFKQDELLLIEEKLIVYLNSINNKPIPQNKILKEIGTSDAIIKYFPEIFKEINTKNKKVKQRNLELIFCQREAILRQTIISIYSKGIYPSIKQIELNTDFKIRRELDVSRRKIMEELGIEVMRFPQ